MPRSVVLFCAINALYALTIGLRNTRAVERYIARVNNPAHNPYYTPRHFGPAHGFFGWKWELLQVAQADLELEKERKAVLRHSYTGFMLSVAINLCWLALVVALD